MEKILAPTLIDPIRKLASEVIMEARQQEKDVRMSKGLQELEPLLEEFRCVCERYDTTEIGALWHMRPVIRKIIELYGQNNNCSR